MRLNKNGSGLLTSFGDTVPPRFHSNTRWIRVSPFKNIPSNMDFRSREKSGCRGDAREKRISGASRRASHRQFLIRRVIAATDRKPNVNRKRRFHGTHSDRSKVLPPSRASLRALVTVTLEYITDRPARAYIYTYTRVFIKWIACA